MAQRIQFSERKVIRILVLILSGILVLLSIIGDKGVLDLRKLKTEEQKLQAEIQILSKKQAEWMAKIDSMKRNKSYIETLAREKLGLIKKNELVFQLEYIFEKETTTSKEKPAPKKLEKKFSPAKLEIKPALINPKKKIVPSK
jgi:cell division protein FtsB